MGELFAIMAFLGAFLVLSMAICVAVSIEAKESELVSKIMTVLLIIGLGCFLVGFFGSIICYFF
jgi:hypothetical protein